MGNYNGSDYLTHLFYFDDQGTFLSERDITADIPVLTDISRIENSFRFISLSVLGDGGVLIAQTGTSNAWIFRSPGVPVDFSGYGITSIGGVGGSHFPLDSEVLVKLSSFSAMPSYKAVTLQWQTESEIDTLGFNLHRAESEDGEYVKINPSLIQAEASPIQGATYQFVDDNVKNRRTYYYKLEDVDVYGTGTMHGPVSAMPRVINKGR